MNPYETRPETAFWAPSVGRKNPFDISGLWQAKGSIGPRTKIATFGSCFAQHFSRSLLKRDFSWVNAEPGPRGLSEEKLKEFNYGVFSARTGNIYTSSMLRQWVEWALERSPAPEEAWERDGRIYDPFRPNVEPNGFESVEEMLASRRVTLAALREVIANANLLVFTLGLTECWINSEHGYEYAICPGTTAGSFDAQKHQFVNLQYPRIVQDLRTAIGLMRSVNKRLRILLTVSPVPLTATMSENHVLVATIESKSTLRAAAGAIARDARDVEYFPSYEIISSHPFRGMFFQPNQRNVNQHGVDHVMAAFFAGLGATAEPPRKRRAARQAEVEASEPTDTQCDEELLAAFAPDAREGQVDRP